MGGERIEDDRDYMRLALAEAEIAFERGEVPVGAVLVREGCVIAKAHNQREEMKDPSAHAEILAFRRAAISSDSWRFSDATLYVTKEPCIMCAGAIVNARIARLVYGCADPKAGGVDSLYRIPADSRLNHRVDIVSGMLEDECASLLRRFFRLRR